MAAHSGVEARRALKGGVVAGLVGGIVLSLFMVLMNLLRGEDPFVPMKVAAYPFLGEIVFREGVAIGPMLLGIAIHLGVSVGWGILFGLLFYGLSRAATLGVSLAWGVVVWLVMFYVALPLVGAGDMARSAPKAMAILEHMLFGLSVGIGFLPFQHPRVRGVTHGGRVPVGA